MDSKLAVQVRELFSSGSELTVIFRGILDKAAPSDRTRMFLFRELNEVFDIPVEVLSIIGGWSYWDKSGYGDNELNSMLAGTFRLRNDVPPIN